MLGKTIKYEFSATGRYFGPMFAVLVLMSIITRLFYTGSSSFALPQAIIILVMVMAFTAVWVMTVAIILRRFWVNLLGREGYLMNTLPVSIWAHVFAKLLVAAVWVILAAIISIAAILLAVSAVDFIHDIQWRELFEEFEKMCSEAKARGIYGGCVLIALQAVLYTLSATMFTILHTYTAMSIGQLVNKHRIWASIGAYIGISIIMTSIFSGINTGWFKSIFLGTSYMALPSDLTVYIDWLNHLLLIFNLQSLAGCAVCYTAPCLLLGKRLNLQ